MKKIAVLTIVLMTPIIVLAKGFTDPEPTWTAYLVGIPASIASLLIIVGFVFRKPLKRWSDRKKTAKVYGDDQEIFSA